VARPKRIVEPYLGAGGYIISCDKPAIGIDLNEDIITLWTWLRDEATEDRLYEIRDIVRKAVKQSKDDKPDVRDLGLSPGEMMYVRVNITGAYVGQLSSWKIYPQHNLPINQTIPLLERLENVELIHGDADDYEERDGDLVFVDPPYIDTRANYKQGGKSGIEEGYDPASTIRLLRRISSPVIFTYGTNAPDVFPEFEWRVVLKKKVPRLRGGGTVDRIEHVTYLN